MCCESCHIFIRPDVPTKTNQTAQLSLKSTFQRTFGQLNRAKTFLCKRMYTNGLDIVLNLHLQPIYVRLLTQEASRLHTQNGDFRINIIYSGHIPH